MSPVREVFTPAFLRKVAGDGPFSRGAAYERDGRVTVTRDQDSRLEAIVHGTEPYAVALWLDQLDRPDWFCACPAAGDGSLCKHTVATALTLSASPSQPTATSTRPGPLRPSPAREPLPAPDVRAWGKQVTKAFAAGGRFVDYRHAPHWAAGVHDILDDLQRLLDGGHAAAVLTLAEQAHKRAETALNRIDDSDGWLTDISRRIADLHQRAAASARPEHRPFATRLFDLETGSHTLDTFHRAAATYAQILGPDGLAEYRTLAQAAWDTADHTSPRWGETFRIRQARIGVAIGARTPDELIQITRNDLATPDDDLEIVQLLAEADRTDEAIDWARRGLDRHADRWYQTPRLRDALADLLARQDRTDEVEALFWDAFVRRPTLTGYRQLIDHANDPDAASDRAIGELAGRVGQPYGDGRFTYPEPLIEILHHDGQDEQAWAAYVEYGCDHDLAMRLAKRREPDHPLEAILVYERDVERHIERKGKAAYRAAARQLGHIRTLAARAGHPEAFEAILERVRSEHRLKRTLMGILDAAQLD